MSENYFYSSLSGQEIENTLLGAVRYNTDQQLTTSQKALARQNIGAGEANTQIKIKGFYDTLSDLQQAIPVGNEGDVYAVGTASPYDLYIWDAVNNVWVNNGPISFSDAIIDDNDVSTTSVWSSAKTTNEIAGVSSEVDAVEGSLATYVRPNLLDNWYFVGGGSQGGYGKFPINQRGNTNYNTAGYGIDRWEAENYGTLAVQNGYIGVSKSNSGALYGVTQKIFVPGATGKKMTISALVSGSSLGKGRVSVMEANSTMINDLYTEIEQVNIVKCYSGTFVATADTLKIAIRPYELDLMQVVAIKLELGDTQTLAHQENGVWVLNEIPDYDSELSKCQKYLRVLTYNPPNYTSVYGFGSTTTQINFFFPFQNMVGKPTISPDSGSNWVCKKYDGTAVTITSIESWYASHSMVGVHVNGSGITQNALYYLNTASATPVIFSCEP